MTMRSGRLLGVWVLAMLVAELPAAAQEGRENFVRGLGGVTFGPETAAVIGGGAGIGIARNLQVYFEAGYVTSILPSDAIDMLEQVLNDLGVPISDIEADAPTFYGLFGARFQRAGAGIQPFGEALFGFAHTTGKFSAVIDGIPVDSDDAPVDLGLSSTDPAMGFGGGIVMPIGERTGIEIGYRWMRVLVEEAQNVNKVYGAFRMRF